MDKQAGYKKRSWSRSATQSGFVKKKKTLQGSPSSTRIASKAGKKTRQTKAPVFDKKNQPKKTMWQHKNRPTAQVFWGNPSASRSNQSSKLVQDRTWGLAFQHYSPVNTDFSLKAGSKKMLLSSTLDSSSSSSSPVKGGRLTEDLLHKKYR